MTRIHTHTSLKLTRRMRRLRQSDAIRAMVRETRLAPEMFVLPLFVCEGEGVRREVLSMPGVCQLSVDEALKETAAAKLDGVRSVLLFGLPDRKDGIGTGAYDPEAPVQSAVRAIKRELPDMLVITDVCLCEYTDHGHCGIVVDDEIVNDLTVEQLVRAAVSHAAAGADIVAPSDMMDGRVGAIREGADMVMVKPGLPYLDIVRRVKDTFGMPTAVYQVSGEYAMLKAAAQAGWLDERACVLEALTGMKRAGADAILTYYAIAAAQWLR